VATFEGHLDADAGRASAEQFARAVAGRPCDVVWDVRQMTGYDAAARAGWQEAVWPNRHNIRSLAVVGASTLIKAGAVMLAVFIGAPWRFVESPEELDEPAA